MPLPPLDPSAGLGASVRGALLGVPAVIVLFITVVAYNAFQLLALVVFPFSPRIYRAAISGGAAVWWKLCLSLARACHGVQVVFSGDPIRPGENALIVANHQQMTDITFLLFAAEKGGRLGDLKWFVKDEVKYVPGIGWGMLLLDNLFVKREWARDKEKIRKTFDRLKRSERPYWVVLFAEGTRLTGKKLERSKRILAAKKKKVLQHLLVPHTRGFTATVTGLEGSMDAVYDLTFGYKDGVPSLWHYILGFARTCWIHVRRFDVTDIPSEPRQGARWMEERFEEKDALLDEFFRSGSFDGE